MGELITPKIKNIHLFADDGGSGEMDFVGFTSLMIDEYTSDSIRASVKGIMEKHGIEDMHARLLKRKDGGAIEEGFYKEVYSELFSSALEKMSRANYVLLNSILTTTSIIETAAKERDDLFSHVVGNLRSKALSKKQTAAYSYLSFPATELLKQVSMCSPDIYIQSYVDKRIELTSLLDDLITIQATKVALVSPLREVCLRVLNAYSQIALKKDCRFNLLAAVDRRDWPQINLVDAFANFSFNFAKCAVIGYGHCSKFEKLKHDIFRDTVLASTDADVAKLESEVAASFALVGGTVQNKTGKVVSTFRMSHA